MNLKKNVPNIIFFLVGAFSLFLAVKFSFDNDLKEFLISAWLIISLFCFILAFPGNIKSINFLGSKMELHKAQEEISKLKLLAKANTRALFELMQTQMRFGGVPDEEKRKYYNQLTDTLKKIGFKEAEIKEIQSRWHYWVEGDYVRKIINIDSTTHPLVKSKKQKEWNKKREELKEEINKITPDELRKIFSGFCDDDNTVRINTLIDDFEYYVNNKKHLNFENWNNRDKWLK